MLIEAVANLPALPPLGVHKCCTFDNRSPATSNKRTEKKPAPDREV